MAALASPEIPQLRSQVSWFAKSPRGGLALEHFVSRAIPSRLPANLLCLRFSGLSRLARCD